MEQSNPTNLPACPTCREFRPAELWAEECTCGAGAVVKGLGWISNLSDSYPDTLRSTKPNVTHLPVNVLDAPCQAQGCTLRIQRTGDEGPWRHVGGTPRHLPVPPADLEPDTPVDTTTNLAVDPDEPCPHRDGARGCRCRAVERARIERIIEGLIAEYDKEDDDRWLEVSAATGALKYAKALMRGDVSL